MKVLARYRAALALLLIGLAGSMAVAHESRPAYLRITEKPNHHLQVFWKQPVMGERAVRLIPHLSGGWLEQEPTQMQATSSFLLKTWADIKPGEHALQGQTLSIEGLENTITDVLVEITLADGQQIREILKPNKASMQLSFTRKGSLAVPAYLRLGVEHILAGFDHLLFVLGLVLLVRERWQLLATITAFTLAHSLTLAGATLGLVHANSALIEALIALSIVFLAVELVNRYRGQRSGLMARYPWLIAFLFGLLHGFGFAGALADIGLPADNIPLALLLFNVGVEVGQLLFVGAVLTFAALLRRLPRPLPPASRWVAPYVIGCCAAFWFIERFLSLMGQGA